MSGAQAKERLGLPMGAVAALWGFAEAVLFFVVPDVLIGWLALRRGVGVASVAALLATVAAAAGGGFVYAWSAHDPDGAARVIERVPAVPAGAVANAAEVLREEDWRSVLRGAFAGIPYKVWSAAAPHAGWKLDAWLMAAAPVRLPRFLLVAAAFALLGATLRKRLSNRAVAALFAAGWTLFYAAFWSLAPW